RRHQLNRCVGFGLAELGDDGSGELRIHQPERDNRGMGGCQSARALNSVFVFVASENDDSQHWPFSVLITCAMTDGLNANGITGGDSAAPEARTSIRASPSSPVSTLRLRTGPLPPSLSL